MGFTNVKWNDKSGQNTYSAKQQAARPPLQMAKRVEFGDIWQEYCKMEIKEIEETQEAINFCDSIIQRW